MRFLEPETLGEALETLAASPDTTRVVAGGTALVLMVQQRLVAPETLISLEHVPELNAVERDENGVHIGPMIRLRDVAASPLIREFYPALASACGVVGNVRVRNQATLGGNLAEADYASDPPTVLLALDAWVTAADRLARRDFPMNEFFLGFYTTTLEPGQVIETIHIPPLPTGTRMTYLKYRSRSSEDRPCVGVAVVAAFDSDRCSDLRVAVGAACEVPRRLFRFEQMAQGQLLTDELVAEIAEGYAANIETLDDMRGSAWYRTQMIRVHVRRALAEVRDGRR